MAVPGSSYFRRSPAASALGTGWRFEHVVQRNDRATRGVWITRRALVPGGIQHERGGELSLAAGEPDGRLAAAVFFARSAFSDRTAAQLRGSHQHTCRVRVGRAA